MSEVPHNLEVERKVLQACFGGIKPLVRVLSMLEAEDFYSEAHRILFNAIKGASKDNRSIESSTVQRYLPSGGHRDLLNDIAAGFPSGANAHLYARDVLEASRARKSLDVADRLKMACSCGDASIYDGAPLSALSELEQIMREDRSKESARNLGDSLDHLAEWIDHSRENTGVKGIRTGIGALDNVIKGLNKKRMYVVAGRPGSGKSLLCAQIGLSVARQGKRVLLCSTEMDADQYMERLACAIAGIAPDVVEAGRASHAQNERILLAGAEIRDLHYMVSDRGTQTTDDIRSDVMRYEPDLLIVDYLQRLMPNNRKTSRYEQVSQISFDLDRIKSDFHIPVIAAAQLNRSVDGRQDKRPVMSDLRDSGTIEQDADAIGMLYRPSQYDDDADPDVIHFELEKNRQGKLFSADLFTGPGMWIFDSRGLEEAS